MPGFIASQLLDGNRLVLNLLDIILRRRLRHVSTGWGLRRGLWVHGVATPLDYVRLTRDYSLEGRVEAIACGTGIGAAELRPILITQAVKLSLSALMRAKSEAGSFDAASAGTAPGAQGVGRARLVDVAVEMAAQAGCARAKRCRRPG